jgi:hypothetical protein
MLVMSLYLPQATEEDHGADPFKSTEWNCALAFGAAVAPFVSVSERRRQKSA